MWALGTRSFLYFLAVTLPVAHLKANIKNTVSSEYSPDLLKLQQQHTKGEYGIITHSPKVFVSAVGKVDVFEARR